jgi:glutamate 5-kinase
MRDFSKSKRIVIKIGTNTLSANGGVDTAYFRGLAGQVKQLRDLGKQVVIVTSGAIGMGAMELKLPGKASGIKMRQACAAIGQPILMQEYRKAFGKEEIVVSQILLTAWVLNNRTSYLNLRNSIETLLGLGVVPILNENDSISTAEIGSAFGDNDKLSALVASKLDADLLIMLTDIDALYDRDPRKHADAKPISEVFEITADIEKNAGSGGSTHSTGGMKTKIEAARIASNAGCRIVLANGRTKDVIARIIAGEEIGTVFYPKRRLSARSRWILHSAAAGTVRIDSGALAAIRNKKSLLPKGVTAVEGEFAAGSVIRLNENAKAVSAFSSSELQSIAGKHSSEIKSILGPGRKDVIATPEDIVLIED